MKPITSLLIALALIFYVFLPFYEIAFLGNLSGFSFTAGTITRQLSAGNTIFALLPFLSCFFAIGFNVLKGKRWGFATIGCVALGLVFFLLTAHPHNITLEHQPEVLPTDDIGEGFGISSLGAGYYLSCVVWVLSLISAMVAMLPLKFNRTIERVVDDTIDRGIEDMRTLGHRLHHEAGKDHHETAGEAPATGDNATTDSHLATAADEPNDREDHSRFMPK